MAKKPNLLFFGIDSLRRDHMSLYGYNRLTTPNIDKYLKMEQYTATVSHHTSQLHLGMPICLPVSIVSVLI